MEPSSRLHTIRKEIRREHLDSFFASKRIKLLEELTNPTEHQSAMEVQKETPQTILNCVDWLSLSDRDLGRVAKLSQSESGIQSIYQLQIQQHLLKYLGQQFTDSDKQYYASYILCNLYYLPLAFPSQSLTAEVMSLLERGDMRTLENLFFLLNNVISNFPNWLELLIKKHHFIDRLANLFRRFEKPTLPYLKYLVQIIFKCLQIAGKDERFVKLKMPLVKLVLQKESEPLREIIKKAVYCYYTLVKNFASDVTPNIVRYGILPKLVELTAFFAQKRYTLLVLQIIQLSLNQLTEDDVQSIVIPYLVKLASLGFELGDQSALFRAQQLKLQACCLIKLLLESSKLEVEYFCSLKLGEVLFQEFEGSQDSELLMELCYIFVQVWLNSSNEQLKATIGQLIKRAQRYNSEDLQFSAFLTEFQNSI